MLWSTAASSCSWNALCMAISFSSKWVFCTFKTKIWYSTQICTGWRRDFSLQLSTCKHSNNFVARLFCTCKLACRICRSLLSLASQTPMITPRIECCKNFLSSCATHDNEQLISFCATHDYEQLISFCATHDNVQLILSLFVFSLPKFDMLGCCMLFLDMVHTSSSCVEYTHLTKVYLLCIVYVKKNNWMVTQIPSIVCPVITQPAWPNFYVNTWSTEQAYPLYHVPRHHTTGMTNPSAGGFNQQLRCFKEVTCFQVQCGILEPQFTELKGIVWSGLIEKRNNGAY